MGLSVAISGGIVMFTLIYMMLIIPGIVDKTASMTTASSDILTVENSILKTDIELSDLVRPQAGQFMFNMTNTGNEKLWNYGKFTVIISYPDGTTQRQTVLTYSGSCGGGFPAANHWCLATITYDNIDPDILNTDEVLFARITVNPVSIAGTTTVIVTTDNGVVDTITIPVDDSTISNIGNKRWGSFVPTSTTTQGDGILATSLTLDGTETFTYDATTNMAAISSACATSAGSNCGVVQTAADFDVFRRDQNSYLYAEWRQNEITSERLFIGFRSGATALPPGDTNAIVDSINAFGICIRTTDTLYQRCENDATGTGTYTSLGVTQDTNYHYTEIYADAPNNQWCVKLDGGLPSCATADIPAATSRMWMNVEAETDNGSGTTLIYGTIHVRNDR